jgi:hypothetical protein
LPLLWQRNSRPYRSEDATINNKPHMGFITPAGRTSSVTWEGKTFQVQTEFVTRPNPKVVSSIILDGKLIHKVDKTWKGEIKTEEQKEIEQFLKKEHEKVTRALKKNPYDFLSGGKEDFQSQVQRLSGLKEIDNPFILMYDGSPLYPDKKDEVFLKKFSKTIAQALRLASSLTDSSKLGEIRAGILEYPPDKIVWVYYNDRVWAAFLKKGSPVDETLQKMGNLIVETYE